MIGWLHAELTPVESLIGMPTDGTAYVERCAKPTQPAFALGRANKSTPYLVGTPTGLQMLDFHSAHNSAPLMGDQPFRESVVLLQRASHRNPTIDPTHPLTST